MQRQDRCNLSIISIGVHACLFIRAVNYIEKNKIKDILYEFVYFYFIINMSVQINLCVPQLIILWVLNLTIM